MATSIAQRVTLTNTGSGPLTVGSITATGDFAQTNDYTAAVGTNGVVNIDVTFTPTASGNRTGSLSIASDGSATPIVITLAGTGVVAPSAGLQRLSIAGNQFVNPAGNPVRLKSVNWFGAESTNFTPHGTWARPYTAIIDQIASFGFNCLRIPFSGDFCNATTIPNTAVDWSLNPTLVGKSPLQVLDMIIAYAKSKGIYTVLDHHRRTAGAGADGAPTDGTYSQAQWISDWNVLAARYASEVAVVGADLHNEPHDLAWDAWATACEACGNAILATAPDWLIFVEGVGINPDSTPYWWGGALKGVATRPIVLNVANKVAYSPHEYGQSVGSQTWLATDSTTPANWPMNLFPVWHDNWGFIFEQNIAPIWIGEFGGKFGLDGLGGLTQPNASPETTWAQTLVEYLNGDFDGNGTSNLTAGKLGLSFAYWSYNPNSGDTGGLVRDDWITPQQPKLTIINPLLV